MKGSNVDVCPNGMECPGSVGDHLCDIHQVEAKLAIEVFRWYGAPAQSDEGGGEGGARG